MKVDHRKITKKMKGLLRDFISVGESPSEIYSFCQKNLETLLNMKKLGFLNENGEISGVIDVLEINFNRKE